MERKRRLLNGKRKERFFKCRKRKEGLNIERKGRLKSWENKVTRRDKVEIERKDLANQSG